MSIDNAHVEKIKEYQQVDLLDPESASFDPEKVETAGKAIDQSSAPKNMANHIKEIEKPVEGRPVRRRRVFSKLVGKSKKIIMSLICPQILMRYGRQNQPIRVPIENQLIDPVAQSYIAADTTAVSSSIVVQNGINFPQTCFILVAMLATRVRKFLKSLPYQGIL